MKPWVADKHPVSSIFLEYHVLFVTGALLMITTRLWWSRNILPRNITNPNLIQRGTQPTSLDAMIGWGFLDS